MQLYKDDSENHAEVTAPVSYFYSVTPMNTNLDRDFYDQRQTTLTQTHKEIISKQKNVTLPDDGCIYTSHGKDCSQAQYNARKQDQENLTVFLVVGAGILGTLFAASFLF